MHAYTNATHRSSVGTVCVPHGSNLIICFGMLTLLPFLLPIHPPSLSLPSPFPPFLSSYSLLPLLSLQTVILSAKMVSAMQRRGCVSVILVGSEQPAMKVCIVRICH